MVVARMNMLILLLITTTAVITPAVRIQFITVAATLGTAAACW